mgnify:CR=1 FL=1
MTRWREDITTDAWGMFIYVRDLDSREVWSTTYQPTGREPDEYEVTFAPDRATFRRVAFTSVESTCTQALAGGWFVSEQTGFLALADGTIYRTDNNGDTFARKTPLPGAAPSNGQPARIELRFLRSPVEIRGSGRGEASGSSSDTLDPSYRSTKMAAARGAVVEMVAFGSAASGATIMCSGDQRRESAARRGYCVTRGCTRVVNSATGLERTEGTSGLRRLANRWG